MAAEIIGSPISKPVLCVGLCCIDDCLLTRHYPLEDSKVGVSFDTSTGNRCLNQTRARGGNASNNCTVLSQLGISSEIFCTFARDELFNFLQKDLREFNIKFDKCPVYDDCSCPNSTVLISQQTGSRTIVHANLNLPELKLSDFTDKIHPLDYAWIHFEGRNVPELSKILQSYYSLKRRVERPTISVEIEKMKPEIMSLLYLADVVFISKDFANMCGQHNMTDAVKYFSNERPGITIICAWSEQGAAAYNPLTNTVVYSPAFPPADGIIVDTLGAGDTFNAAVISRLLRDVPVEEAIRFGCRVAGAKCGQNGLKGLDKLPFIVKS